MKIELGQFGNRFKSIYIFGSHPIQDWHRILLVGFSIVLGVLIWSYFFYFSVQSEFRSDFNSSTEFVPVKDKEAEIKEVVEKYKAKEVLWGGMATTTKVGSGASAGATTTTKTD
jgi:hypothetical protein